MLPFRFAKDPGSLGPDPVVFVDGSPVPAAAGRTGDLHISHWPGNSTPPALKRPLSTEIAFAFTDLDEAERARLVGGATAYVLNHFDTDGVCALYVLLRTAAAREHREALHAIAAAGDFFEARSERAVAVEAALRNLGQPERSAVAADLAGLEGDARSQRLVEAALDVLGEMLVDERAHAHLFEPELERYRRDLTGLAAANFDDLVYLDFGVWTGRPAGGGAFDPGRHAFFGDGRRDRALLLGALEGGTTARFVIGTRSFFDGGGPPGSPRPDLEGIVQELRARERAAGGDDTCDWHAQDVRGASPELWFGRAGLPLYPEHAGAFLGTSRLDPIAIKAVVLDAIRDSWRLPDDDDEADEGEDIFAV